MAPLLAVDNLHAEAGGKEILSGISLGIAAGEIHFLMGPNGSGKSTFAHALAGHPAVRVSAGSAIFGGEDLLTLPPEARAKKGIHLWPQQSAEVTGVGMTAFLRSAAAARGEPRAREESFRGALAPLAERALMPASLLERNLHEGFSGGEKKRSELLQLLFFRPRLAILDECDSGLDADGVRAASGVLAAERREGGAFIVITHGGALGEYLKPDAVHILVKGKIIKSGGPELVAAVERRGFAPFGA